MGYEELLYNQRDKVDLIVGLLPIDETSNTIRDQYIELNSCVATLFAHLRSGKQRIHMLLGYSVPGDFSFG